MATVAKNITLDEAVQKAAASFLATTAKTPNYMRGLKEDNSAFSNLEELRAAYPKLFEVTGDFNVMIR